MNTNEKFLSLEEVLSYMNTDVPGLVGLISQNDFPKGRKQNQIDDSQYQKKNEIDKQFFNQI